MEQSKNKTVVSAVVITAALGLAVLPAAAQTKGSDPSSSPSSASEKKDSGSASGRSDSSMKSSDAMKDAESAGQRASRGTSGRWNKEDVKKVQEALKDKGNDPGPADGVLGPQTQKAIRAFQSSQGLKSTGRLDDETAKALGVEHGASSSGSSSMGTGSSSRSKSSPGSSAGSTGKTGEPASK